MAARGVVERRRRRVRAGRGAGFGARYRSDRIPSCGRSRASSERATVRPAKTSTWLACATAWGQVSAAPADAAAGPAARASRRRRAWDAAGAREPSSRSARARRPPPARLRRPALALATRTPSSHPTPEAPRLPTYSSRLIIPATLAVRMWVSFLAIDAIIRCEPFQRCNRVDSRPISGPRHR